MELPSASTQKEHSICVSGWPKADPRRHKRHEGDRREGGSNKVSKRQIVMEGKEMNGGEREKKSKDRKKDKVNSGP